MLKRRSGEGKGNLLRVTSGRKALKGQAQERWGLKDIPQGWRADIR
jgi:hypothetical protein